MDNEKRIQDYFANRLSEKEKVKFEQLLETDLDLKTEFESYKDVAMAFKISEAASLKKRFQQLEGKPKQKGLFSNYRYLYLAIASIIVIGFFYNTFTKQSGNQLFDTNFEIYPNTYQPVTRSSEANANNNAFIAYENGDFLTAENELKSSLELSNNPNIQFYYASALLNQLKFNQALKEFETLSKLEFDYTEESLWYAALIHTKNQDFKTAKEYLEKLNSHHSKFKSKEREVLLQKLKD